MKSEVGRQSNVQQLIARSAHETAGCEESRVPRSEADAILMRASARKRGTRMRGTRKRGKAERDARVATKELLASLLSIGFDPASRPAVRKRRRRVHVQGRLPKPLCSKSRLHVQETGKRIRELSRDELSICAPRNLEVEKSLRRMRAARALRNEKGIHFDHREEMDASLVHSIISRFDELHV